MRQQQTWWIRLNALRSAGVRSLREIEEVIEGISVGEFFKMLAEEKAQRDREGNQNNSKE